MMSWAKSLLIAAVAALAPVHAVMITVGILVFIDLFTGVWAAIKRGEKVSSAKLRDTVSKLVIFQIAVVSAFLLEKFLLHDLLPVSKLVAGVIGVVEATSLFENLNVIYGRNIFQGVIDKLGSNNKPVKNIENGNKNGL